MCFLGVTSSQAVPGSGTVEEMLVERVKLRRWLLLCATAILTGTFVSGSVGAEPSTHVRDTAAALRRESAALDRRSHAALLELYAVERRLAGARSLARRLVARKAALERERALVRHRLVSMRRSLRVAEEGRARRLRFLYERGEEDPLAILLGAASLTDALAEIDGLSRTASLDRDVVTQVTRASASLGALGRSLRARHAEVDRVERRAAATVRELASARAERSVHVQRLAMEQRMNKEQIGALARRAREAATSPPTVARRSERQASPPSSASSAAPPATAAYEEPRNGASLTVLATAYSIRGRTATGLPTSWGVVAVDPAVIPLGTRMTIPGYGEGVAADTGGAVRGAMIDVWFPRTAQALAWGTRTVTITLHR